MCVGEPHPRNYGYNLSIIIEKISVYTLNLSSLRKYFLNIHPPGFDRSIISKKVAMLFSGWPASDELPGVARFNFPPSLSVCGFAWCQY